MASIQGIYIALFGRPADPLGLDYFNSITNGGRNLSQINSLAGEAEYLDRFEGQNNAQIVTQIYNDLFGRNPDAAGLAFFVAQLNSGTQNINTIAINILDGARGEDAALVAAKIAAADQFTAAVRADPDALAAYQGDNGIAFGQQFIAQIDSSDDKLTNDEVAAQVDTFGNTGGGGEGSVFTLTAATNVVTGGADSFTGTAANDTFRAVVANSLDSSDILNGGAGTDNLTIAAGGIAADAVPVISNIEIINNAGGDLDLSSVTGVDRINSSADADYTGASTATTFAATAAGTDVTVDYTGTLTGDTTIHLATDLAADGAVSFASADGAAIENVTLDVAGAGTSAVTLGATFTGLESIVVTGEGDLTLTNATVGLEVFDASAATGDINFTTAAVLTEDLIATGGAGNDTLSFANATGDLTLNGGAGNDTLVGGAGDDTITLNGGDAATGGAGDDAYIVSGGADVGAGNSITGFTLADDTISFGGEEGDADNYFESAVAAGSFTEAREAAQTAFAADADYQYVAVDFGANVVVFYNGGEGSTVDSAVTLLGVQLGGIDATAIV